MKKEDLEDIEQLNLMESPPGARTVINGKEYDYFGGTSYYELHKNKEVVDSAVNALLKYGINSSSSRSSYGTTQLLIDVEKEAADYFNCEDAIYLSSGFLTDMAAMQVFISKQMADAVFIDENAHYSNEYAARLSGKPIHKFRHLSETSLEEKILENIQPGQRPLIVTDGIFPIFGEIAPIDKYSGLAEKYNGTLWVDDAHSIGVLGKNGRGTYEHFGITSDRCYFGGTLSKAFGGFGGIIPGDKKFITEIKNSQIQNGTTPPPSSAAAASLTGLKLVKANPAMRLKLWENATRLKKGLKTLGIEVENSIVPIAAWTMGGKYEMQTLQLDLKKKGIVIQNIHYVGAGKDGALRIVVFSSHTEEQIENLIYELGKIM